MSSPSAPAGSGGFGRGRPITPGLREARRSTIVQSAYSVLTERGYERTSVSDIAKHAGVGQATVYRYFTSKRELLDHVFDYAVEKAARAIDIDALLAQGDGPDEPRLSMISALGQSLFALVDDDPAIVRLLTVESSAIDPELRCRVIGLFDAIQANVTLLFERFGPSPSADRTVLGLLGRMMMGSGAPGLMMTLTKENSHQLRADFLATAESIAGRGLLDLSGGQSADETLA